MDDGSDGVKKEKIFFSSRGECGKKLQTNRHTNGYTEGSTRGPRGSKV